MIDRLGGAAVWIRHRPITVSLAAIVLAVHLASAFAAIGSRPHRSPVLDALATGHDQVLGAGRWWTALSYPLASWGTLQLIIALIAILGVVGLFERRMPRAALLLSLLVTALGGAVVGIAAQAIGVATGLPLLAGTTGTWIADPLVLVAGTAGAGSAWLGPIGRRRTRVLLLVAVLVLLVYIGHPSALYKLGAALAGIVAGAVLGPGERRAGWRPSTAIETRQLLAWSTAALGIGPMAAMLVPQPHSIASPLTAFVGDAPLSPSVCDIWRVTSECVLQRTTLVHLSPAEVLVSALPWTAFVLIGWGLARGLRFARQAGAVLSFCVAALLIWFWGIGPLGFADYTAGNPLAARADAVELVVQLVSILAIHLAAGVVLLASRRAFPVTTPRRVLVRSSLVVAGTAIGLMALFVAWAVSDAEPFAPPPSLGEAILSAPERLLPPLVLSVSPSGFVPITETAEFLSGLSSPVFTLVALGALQRGMRAARPELDTVPASLALERLREGGTSMSYLGIWDGNEHWLDEPTGACVAYRRVEGVAIALGGPFGGATAGGDADAAVGVLRRFAAAAEGAGLVPCAYSVPGEWRERLESQGWSTLEVAEESVVDLAAWSTKGKKWQDVRTSINRADRAGIELEWTAWDDLTVRRAREIEELNDRWVGGKPLPEMGFTLGGVAELAAPGTLLVIASDPEGRIHAVASWLPCWREGRLVGRTLDFMRRDPESMNGAMEMVIARAAERFREEGLEWLSLSGAPLAASAGAAPDASGTGTARMARLLDQLGRLLEPVYGFRSLLGFKRKFQPEFRPLLMAYPDAAQLPNIGLALSAAYLPGVGLGEAVQALRPRRPRATAAAPAEAEGAGPQRD